MGLFKNKYRSESHRRPKWDYSSEGIYFITVLIEHRKCLLGKIENEEFIPSAFGKIATEEWYKSFELRKELFLDAWIMMPNHWHALITLNPTVDTHGRAYQNDEKNQNDETVDTHGRAYQNDENKKSENEKITDTHDRAYLQYRKMPVRKPKSISSFVGGYKSAVISKVDDFIDELQLPIEKYNRFNKLWQNNYHDHIIRNHEEYWIIKNYIINNPKNWKGDRFHP